MSINTYEARRDELRHYFDRTARRAWEQLTSDAPVSRIRQTVRAGRDDMRRTLLEWLPGDLTGQHILDAGCGTGALSIALAERGARVTAIDLSPALVKVAHDRTPAALLSNIDYRAGDMLNPVGGPFDAIVAMDSLIHYSLPDMSRSVQALLIHLVSVESRLLITFAPGTPALHLMHRVGKLFPRRDRSPAIVPIGEARLREALHASHAPVPALTARTRRISSGFYKSQALEIRRA